LSSTW